ncbi:helix-turn-helix domain-containing protein [Paucisalibacillus globulus]|uniref:helix-turn-helix domain-containing protein n=1 Tax=Paucisalibacillus globulus TaxID=351095 RepID=UPI0020D0A137|nr:helix-turn-helix transcriptional regulator [Paucisalibacillus globulus]
MGAVLKRMRRRSGLSQEALAEKIHMSRSNISKLESGKLDVRGKDLIRWAQETSSQDILVALVCNVDIATATDMFMQVTRIAGTILIGWF